MARPTKEYDSTTKKARARLDVRAKPYYRHVGPGKSLGYVRRDPSPGAWIVREWEGGRYKTRIIGLADDLGLPDGKDVLSFAQALRKATDAALPTPRQGRLTVRQAVDGYITSLAARSLHSNETKQRADKHILPALGGYRIDRLTKTQIERWRDGMVRDDPDDEDAKRRSQDSANRVLTILKAALNEAFQDEANKIETDAAWRRVKPYRDVGGARTDHFDATQVRQLIAKAKTFDKPFANLLEAGYLIGARYGELAALDVRDFDAGKAVLAIRKGKTGARAVTLTAEAVGFFKKLTDDRPALAILLPRVDGNRWDKSQQAKPFKRAAALAELPASSSFYTLRHSHISRAIDAQMPLSLVAENCGTSLAMIQKNYAKTLAKLRRGTVERTGPKLRRVK
jgi:integrase